MKRQLAAFFTVLVFLFSMSTAALAETTVENMVLNKQQEVDILSKNNIKKINEKVLDMVLAGNAEDVENLNEVKEMKQTIKSNPELERKFLNNIEAFNKNSKPVRVLRNLQINGKSAEVFIFEDSSFSVVTSELKKEGEIETLTANIGFVTKYGNGLGSYSDYCKIDIYQIWLVESLRINVGFTVYSNKITITSVNATGSYCNSPREIVSYTSSTPLNNNINVSARNDYLVKVYAGGGVIPIKTVVDTLRMDISKTGTTSFKISGSVWYEL